VSSTQPRYPTSLRVAFVPGEGAPSARATNISAGGMFVHTERKLSRGALLSVALGFTNLLPFLALDGGRVAVVLIEVLRRRPFDRNSELNFQRIGLAALIAIAVLISALDIQRIASGQFPGLQR